jgi:hypothetical protein
MRARASYPGALASCHPYKIVVCVRKSASTCPTQSVQVRCLAVSPFWIWTQIAIVVFVLIGMVIAITKLA